MVSIWQHYIHPLLESSFFASVLTLSAAGIAYFIYRRQQNDNVRTAASTVLLEIEKAEKHIGDAKKQYAKGTSRGLTAQEKFPENLQVMQTDSWTQYRTLLSKHLSPQIVAEIDDFYSNCKQFDRVMAYIDGTFSRNEAEIRSQTFRVLADELAKVALKFKDNSDNNLEIQEMNTNMLKEYRRFRDDFTASFPQEYSYYPKGPHQDAQFYLELLRTGLMSSRVGTELKRVAGTDKVIVG